MNCKPGDMAILVHSDAGNEGKIVTVIRLASEHELTKCVFTQQYGPVWRIDRPIQTTSTLEANKHPFAIDAWMRPILPPEEPITVTRDEEVTA